jgi:hypothetical protein
MPAVAKTLRPCPESKSTIFAWDAIGLIGYRFDLFGKNKATV